MKTTELKLRIVTEIESLIDVYFGDDTFIDKMTNTTLKILIEQNKNKFDDTIKIFEDENGDVDVDTIVKKYSEQIGDTGIKFDLKKYIKNDILKTMIPDKSLIIHKEDIMKIAK